MKRRGIDGEARHELLAQQRRRQYRWCARVVLAVDENGKAQDRREMREAGIAVPQRGRGPQTNA
jgi:hypothetical protein